MAEDAFEKWLVDFLAGLWAAGVPREIIKENTDLAVAKYRECKVGDPGPRPAKPHNVTSSQVAGPGDMLPQRQDSVTDQLRDVAAMADRMGCYDAADVIRIMPPSRPDGLQELVRWFSEFKEQTGNYPHFVQVEKKAMAILSGAGAPRKESLENLARRKGREIWAAAARKWLEEMPDVEGLPMDGPCMACSGTGMVQVAPNARGMKTCPTCGGKGKLTGQRPGDSATGKELI